MSRAPSIRGLAFVALLLAFAGLACVNHDVHLYEVRLHGSITAADPAAKGVVHVELHHAHEGGSGGLGHPLGLVGEFTIDAPGEYDETAQIPTDDAEGLVLYAWLDLDGDGALCAPGGAIEPAGLVVVDDFPAHDLAVDLALASPCVGPEALYP